MRSAAGELARRVAYRPAMADELPSLNRQYRCSRLPSCNLRIPAFAEVQTAPPPCPAQPAGGRSYSAATVPLAPDASAATKRTAGPAVQDDECKIAPQFSVSPFATRVDAFSSQYSSASEPVSFRDLRKRLALPRKSKHLASNGGWSLVSASGVSVKPQNAHPSG